MTLEQVFQQIAQKHDCHVVDFAMNSDCGPEHRFTASMHWKGFSRDGNPCQSGMGSTFAKALENCLERVSADRGLEPNVDFSEILKVAA